ncbi:unnamed protein product [Hermetia illucens]|uniref:OBP47-like domain-containing protein n=1 Tax=Hermetia illucens TaxID=343691 RepID=A0A7R8UFG3_HERIL|nr:uncharacterized protein LOC119646813 [Hermetia illucens]CAD7079858.1 unnamed protein product [Hermetia illucens]
MFRNISVLLVCSVFTQCLANPDCSQPPKTEVFTDCCAQAGIMKDILKDCNKKFPPQANHDNFCNGECVFNETGISVNGVIQKDKLPVILAEFYQDMLDVVPIAIEMIGKCTRMVEPELVRVLENKPDKADDCNPLPALLSKCFFTEMFLHCPASIWQNTENCNHAKEFLKHCPKHQG